MTRVMPRTPSFGMLPLSCSQMLSMNWCGVTKINAVAPLTASFRSGFAMTFAGSVMPGKYLGGAYVVRTATTGSHDHAFAGGYALDVLVLLVDDLR